MSGSIYGDVFRISTWGESHGPGVGVVVDGCPAGMSLCEEDIQVYLDRRKPGATKYTTPRKEEDEVTILSGVFEGRTTGAPISMMVQNKTQRSKDYSAIADIYRPGHADYTMDAKYGLRDYRGGGRSSGRETIGRVAAGAVAGKILKELGIQITTYTRQIGPYICRPDEIKPENILQSPLCMPDLEISGQAEEYVAQKMSEHDSVGGVVECIIHGMPVGVGEPVFGKLDAALSSAIFSIGAVKGVEIGAGFMVADKSGSENNDEFYISDDGKVAKKTNSAGGILGGMSDGDDIVIRAAFKPTPSIYREQQTINKDKEEVQIKIQGRHDPVIMPRAVVVVESMVAITLVDRLFVGMTSKIDKIRDFYCR